MNKVCLTVCMFECVCLADTFIHLVQLTGHESTYIAHIFAMKMFDFNNIVRLNLTVNSFQNRFNMSFNHINQTSNTFRSTPADQSEYVSVVERGRERECHR